MCGSVFAAFALPPHLAFLYRGLVNGKILLIQKCFRLVGERLIATRKLSTVKTFRANCFPAELSVVKTSLRISLFIRGEGITENLP